MAKLLKDTEMADIIRRATHDSLIDDADQYTQFLEDLADLITDHFGGDRGCVSCPDYPEDPLGWTCGFHVDEDVPADGGVFKKYDTGVTWKDGKEDQV